MSHSRPNFEWHVLEEHNEPWPALPPAHVAQQAQARTYRRWLPLLASVFGATACLVVTGYLLVRRAEAGLRTVETQVQQAVEVEAWTDRNRQPALAAGASDEAPASGAAHDPAVSHQVEILNLQEDRVMAYVQVAPVSVDAAPIYQETRFYRQTADGWQRTALDPALLGPWRSVDTAHFHIHFFQVDAQAVKDAAPRFDAQYEQMRQDYGLPAVDGEAMVTVEVTVPDRSD